MFLTMYDISGIEEFLDRALKSLSCYLVQPPRCLGYYEVGDGWWFRWGSYHHLSSTSKGLEDLLVLNTHLMALVGFSEAVWRGICRWCQEPLAKGLKALENLLEDFQRSDGYFYYSLRLKKNRVDEDIIHPTAIGYHSLSTKLMFRIAIQTGNRRLLDAALRGCDYIVRSLATENLKSKIISVDTVSALIYAYNITKSDHYLWKAINILNSNLKIYLVGYMPLERLNPLPPPRLSIHNWNDLQAMHLIYEDSNSVDILIYVNSKTMITVEKLNNIFGKTISSCRNISIENLSKGLYLESPCEVPIELDRGIYIVKISR